MSDTKIENVTTEEAFQAIGLGAVFAGTLAAAAAALSAEGVQIRWFTVDSASRLQLLGLGLVGVGIGTICQTVPLALKSRRIIAATVEEISRTRAEQRNFVRIGPSFSSPSN